MCSCVFGRLATIVQPLALKENWLSFNYHTMSSYLGWWLHNGLSGSLKSLNECQLNSEQTQKYPMYTVLNDILFCHQLTVAASPETRSSVHTAGNRASVLDLSRVRDLCRRGGVTPQMFDCALMKCSSPEGLKMVASASQICF